MSDAENKNEADAPEEVNDLPASESTEQIEKLNADLEKAKKDHLYLMAEFDNYRKQAIKERSQLMKYANENLLRDIVQVMDNFNLALQNDITAENIESFVTGVKMISKEMQNTVEKYGVIKLKTQGEAFDPSLHEALGSEPSSDVENGHILRVFKDGYKLHDRLLRPAQVIIATEKKDN
ncbi:MAG: nucleotide exchange factor GrpE [Bdellovibrionales bacterium]|nr:nucleotide exchange factor GrpE [Bdellovibrionales bacterium]